MKLRRDDVVRAGAGSPLELFRRGMRAEATSKRYAQVLRQVLCGFLEEVLEGSLEERAAQLVRLGRDDPEWARDLLVSLAWKLRGRTRLPKDDPDHLSPASVPNYFKPLKKMLDMNDVAINWKRVYATYPEPDGMGGSAGWTRAEIARMLRRTRSTQDRALILLLASSGVRAGALPDLNWGDLKPVYRVDGRLRWDPGGEPGGLACAALEVYRGSAEAYTAFVTPEAFAALMEYGREWPELMGRRAGPGDPIFISTRGRPARAARATIRKRLEQAARRAGLRGGGGQGKRHKVPLMNGFRRFYNKTTKDVLSGGSVGALIRAEYMMGHRGVTPLDKNYFKTTALELAAEYVRAVPGLTVDDADRLRNIVREKDVEIARLKAEIVEMRRRYIPA